MGSRLAGKVAIISGAARGQGAAEARLFAAEGAAVVLGDVLDDEGEAVALEIGAAAAFVHLDVTQAASWAAAVERCIATFGAPTILVNNAGVIGPVVTVDRLEEDDLRRVLDVNLIGPFLGTKAVVAAMTGAGGGSIVNISSTAGFRGVPAHGAYTASKFALRGFTKAAALDLGRHNIRVNSIHPGTVDTGLVTRPEYAGVRDPATYARQAIPRIGRTDEIALLALFVASDEASYSTGCEFVADGGSLAGST